MTIEWSHRAETDLRDLYDWIRKDSPFYARQFAERIFAAVEALDAFLEMGRTVPEAIGRNDVREVIYRGYRVIYRYRDRKVAIVTIVHGRRDLTAGPAQPWEID